MGHSGYKCPTANRLWHLLRQRNGFPNRLDRHCGARSPTEILNRIWPQSLSDVEKQCNTRQTGGKNGNAMVRYTLWRKPAFALVASSPKIDPVDVRESYRAGGPERILSDVSKTLWY